MFWSNNRATPVPFSQSAHWSHTGGAGEPQPDNRELRVEGKHDEACIAMLNNFYADGVVSSMQLRYTVLHQLTGVA